MKSISEINSKTLAWGGDKTLALAINKNQVPIEFILDNNQKKWNTEFLGLPIKSPENLKNIDPNKYTIVVFSVHYEATSKQVSDLGWVPEQNIFSFQHF